MASGERVINDHVALRTFDLDPIGLDALAAPFEALGGRESGEYNFEAKRLNARSWRPPEPTLPHVFISELRTGDFSPALQETARRLAAQVEARGVDRLVRRHDRRRTHKANPHKRLGGARRGAVGWFRDRSWGVHPLSLTATTLPRLRTARCPVASASAWPHPPRASGAQRSGSSRGSPVRSPNYR